MPSAATTTRTHKTCTKCGEEKTLDKYDKRKDTRDGRVSHCKTCQSEYHRQYREANHEKIAEQKRRWREENREKVAERDRRYHEENREQIAEKDRRYREKHRDYVNQRTRKNSRERQRLSLYTAHRRHTPWTPDDDEFILTSPMTLFQIAVTLNKTYCQVEWRSKDLRKKPATTR